MLILHMGTENNAVSCMFQRLEDLIICLSENIRSGIATEKDHYLVISEASSIIYQDFLFLFLFFCRRQIGELKGGILATTAPTVFED